MIDEGHRMRVNHAQSANKEDIVASSSPRTLNARRLDFKEVGVVLVTSDAVTAVGLRHHGKARVGEERVCVVWGPRVPWAGCPAPVLPVASRWAAGFGL